jgi:GNAT superfamily N-acetyltransferase
MALADALRVRAVRPDDWDTVAALFGANGACGGCWCMWWRVPRGGRAWEAAKGVRNRRRLRERLQGGRIHAVMAYEGDAPVGWCSFGPRTDFPRLDTVKALRHEPVPGTWSIVCFFIPARQRGRGVATALLRAAAREAFRRGAAVVEGYPVVPARAREPVPAAFAWTGVPALFERAGFELAPGPGAARPIYRLSRVAAG